MLAGVFQKRGISIGEGKKFKSCPVFLGVSISGPGAAARARDRGRIFAFHFHWNV
jgi:hypothetical protein